MAENQPIYFLEVQAFPDDVIYWRVMREVATYFEQRPAQKESAWQAIVLWLNPEDDPGLGTLKPLAHKPHQRLIAVDLLKLLKKLDERALVLNVLRPLLAKSEREVRQHVVQWVENIRQTPNLDRQTEERLVAILSQLIEQKFRTLSYKELTAMLHLTPLRETASVQEVLKEDRVDMLMRQIQTKFSLSAELRQALTTDLFQLDMEALKTLIEQILRINSVEELERWIAEHQPAIQRK